MEYSCLFGGYNLGKLLEITVTDSNDSQSSEGDSILMKILCEILSPIYWPGEGFVIHSDESNCWYEILTYVSSTESYCYWVSSQGK